MIVDISSAPGQFPTLTARMLRLELEAAGIGISETDQTAPALYITVDSSGDTELRRQKQRENSKPAPDERYFKYPFRADAFVAAVKRLLAESARAKANAAAPDSDSSIAAAGKTRLVPVEFFGDERLVKIDGISVQLTEREYKLFRCLYEHRGDAVSRLELLSDVWDGNTGDGTNVVDVYVSYLRRKLEDATGKRLIATRRGHGYEYLCDK